MSDRLEAALFELGSRIDYPETPPHPVSAPEPIRARRGWVLVVAAALVAVVVLAFPGPRQAVANLFGIGSVRIDVLDELPQAVVLREPSGDVTTLHDARNAVDFTILALGREPDVVYFDGSVPGGMVTLGYGGRLYVTQLPGTTEDEGLRKLVLPDTQVDPVTVDGESGLWIEGEGHALVIIDRDGGVVDDSARLAADTLLYTANGVTVRIEGEMDLEQALAIADQLD